MKIVLLFLLCLSAVGAFSTGRPLSHFSVVSLASNGDSNGDANQFRASTVLTSTAAATAEEETKKPSIMNKLNNLFGSVKAAPFALAIATFLLGYKLGGRKMAQSAAAGKAAATSARGAARQYPIIATILLVVAVRDTWSLIPNWAKKNLPFVGKQNQI